MQRVSDYIAQFLVKNGISDVFMLTGYGAMYMNDAIEIAGIKHFACRNEATAPMMAESYARVKQSLGVVCVTAGPGSTNAIPGLAEAWVDSAPILVLSGQVERQHTTRAAHLPKFRTFGTAEIDIIPVVEPLTKFATEVDDPLKIRYYLEKSLYCATSGRPGPVWLSVPIDVQSTMIDENKLEGFTPNVEEITTSSDISSIIQMLLNAKRPIIVCGHGVRQSSTALQVKELSDILKIPVILSRLGQDIFPHSSQYIMGHGGVKGSTSCKTIMQEADFVLSLGCRLAVQFVGMKFQHFSPDCKIAMIDIDGNETKKPGAKLSAALNLDLKKFVPEIISRLNTVLPDWSYWTEHCQCLKKQFSFPIQERNPIDLYYFMSRLNFLSGKRHIFTTDAGSNYYVGGQVFTFDKGQREITSGAFAAMGTSIPLAIGAAVADPSKQILAITGDGSLELNIQELKTISHYGFNIKLFVINNGGYVSMKKWQDTYFNGRRIDDAEKTGAGTLNLKKVAEAFDMDYALINDFRMVDDNIISLLSNDKPVFVEVITDNHQKIIDA